MNEVRTLCPECRHLIVIPVDARHLYTERGALEERARAVARLREEAARIRLRQPAGPAEGLVSSALDEYANEIERGEHVPGGGVK